MEWILKLLVSIVGVIGGCVAAYKGLVEMRAANLQRRLELRWKRAEAARDLIKEIHEESFAMAAIKMLDHTDQSRRYSVGDLTLTLSANDVLKALALSSVDATSESELYVRDCFDWLYYHMGRLEHFIVTGYIDFIDVASVFRCYCEKIVNHLDCHRSLVEERQYIDTLSFLRRFHDLNEQAKHTTSRS